MVESFEHFLHTKYQGQKRFSLEGGESLITALYSILENCGARGVEEICLGMPHRGRLSVIAAAWLPAFVRQSSPV